jgi:hypothetical protein
VNVGRTVGRLVVGEKSGFGQHRGIADDDSFAVDDGADTATRGICEILRFVYRDTLRLRIRDDCRPERMLRPPFGDRRRADE